MAGNKMHVALEELYQIDPLTALQKTYFDMFDDNDILLVDGFAGTGKSFLTMYKALENVLERGSQYYQLLIIRSAVSARDIGHLPGNEEEKSMVFQRPYEAICKELFGRRNGTYTTLKQQGKVLFELSSFQRGMTYNNTIIMVDETQNMTYVEQSTAMTRVGKDCKIIFLGDTKGFQNDLNGKSGLDKFSKVLYTMPSVARIEFGIEDIVRGPLVKEFIIAENNLYGK